jgi:hypothetical protein
MGVKVLNSRVEDRTADPGRFGVGGRSRPAGLSLADGAARCDRRHRHMAARRGIRDGGMQPVGPGGLAGAVRTGQGEDLKADLAVFQSEQFIEETLVARHRKLPDNVGDFER